MQVHKLSKVVVGLVAFTMLSLTGVGTADRQAPRSPVASYVRICKSSRGVPDRRACRGKDDPQRTTLALLD